MTVADRLVEQGRREGRREGRQEAMATVLLKQLRLRFGSLPPEVTRRVLQADIAVLEQGVEVVLSAARLEDVFEA